MIDPNRNSPVLEVSGVTQRYRSGEGELTVLEAVTFAVEPGETVAIVGPSGSGKTTLLGLCAGLDVARAGSVRLLGEPLESLSEDERAALRVRSVGFVFQNFQLLPTLSALENVLAPLELRGDRGAEEHARGLLAAVGLGARASHYPVQLSGGEQQRVALARALANQPAILFADEPTGNLDGATGEHIEEMLFSLHREHGSTLILVTHDRALAERCDRILEIERGHLTERSRVQPDA
jgi:putative ABC transport system ATP-binding protein